MVSFRLVLLVVAISCVFTAGDPSLSLDACLKPKTIAVIGASNKQGSIGYEVLHKITEYGFKGKVFPVNPKGGKYFGLEAAKTITDIPEPVDMAVIVVNAKFVLDTIDQCHQKGVKGLTVITAGFKEIGGKGVEVEKEMQRRIEKYGMRMIGPNCLGIVNTHPDYMLDATFAETLPERGNIGFVSQSGALVAGILNVLKDLKIGFSQLISAGNQPDVNAETALEYWENDDDVHQILLYLETIKNPANFRKLASRITKKKPIIALKSGRSSAGASAASSHTGSLAGSDLATSALLEQSGVIREISLKNLFSTANAFSTCPVPKGKRVAVITNSGGPGIMATDAVIDEGLEMAKISDETKDKMRSYLPAIASVKNPIDMIASAPIEHYTKTLELVLDDPNVDMVIVIYLKVLGGDIMELSKALMETRAKRNDKPIAAVFLAKSTFFNQLSDLKLNMPFFMYAEEAAQVFGRLYRQRMWIDRPTGKLPNYSNVDKNKVNALIKKSLDEGRDQLTTRESIDVLEAYGIRVSKSGFAKSEDEAVAIADKIGYPVVMKMTSKKTSHKTDVGGVRINIQSADQLRAEHKDLINKLKERNLLDGLEGVIIQEMVKGNREMVCGVATDPQYGPMIMFGLGGVFVETMKDVTFKIIPITDIDAHEMIRKVKAFKLLEGARGTKKARLEQVEETLLRLSQLLTDYPYIDELDINPLLISESTGEGIAVDGRIKVRKEEAMKALN
ncbi:MAG: acetate--CoA ligase family protein [archaeon]|nr:acetate--CoA ligase family protein [archaeon]